MFDDGMSDISTDTFGWVKGHSGRKRQQNQAFSVTQLLELPDGQREIMLEINKNEPITLAELANTLDRNPAELEAQLNQLVAQNWLDMEENKLGEWVYRVRMARHSKRILPPGIWQVLDDHWKIPIFRLFSDAALEEFSQRFQLERHAEGTILFRRGDWGERMYVVDSGRINLLVHNQKGESFLVEQVRPGGIVGEMSVTEGERRPYTAYVAEETRVWTLTKSDLDYLLAQHPAAGLAVRQELARQMKPTPRPAEAKRQHNPIVAVGESGGELACHLAEQDGASVVLIDLVGKQPSPLPNLTYIDGTGMRSRTIAESVQAQVANQAWVIIASFPQMTDQLMRVIGLAEVVIDLTGSSATWLRAASRRYWSVPSATPLNLSRLARRLCGRTTGLALSGGAARTIAHLGVLDVLHRAGIQFDVIASCGYGAFWSALYAAGHTPQELIDLALNRLSKLQPFGGWLGLRSTARPGLFDLRPVRGLVHDTVSGLRFSELKTPCYLVASDLVTGEIVWINEGNLFSALSACLATPGLVTPVEYQNRLLVDAILNNPLPADVVAAHGADIVLTSSVIPVPSARQQKSLDLQKQNLVTSWLGVCDVVAHERSLDHLNSIDLLIVPDVAAFADTAFGQAPLLVEKGREAAEKALPRIQSLLRSEPYEDPDRR